jgi:hypothetical protein
MKAYGWMELFHHTFLTLVLRRWEWVVNFARRLFYIRGKSPRGSLDGSLGEFQSRPGQKSNHCTLRYFGACGKRGIHVDVTSGERQ